MPTDEELWQIVNYFNPENHQKLSSNDLTLQAPEISEDLIEKIPNPETFEMPCLNPPAESEEIPRIILQSLDKQELVTQQVSALSIALDQSELRTVASSIADEYQTFEDAVKEVTAFIKIILHQRHLKASNALNKALQDIVGTAQKDFTTLSQQASQGFSTIAVGLQEANTDFKSRAESIKATLSEFLLY